MKKRESFAMRLIMSLLAVLTSATAWAQTTETLGDYTFTIQTDADGQYYKVDCEAALRGLSAYSAGNNCKGKRFKQTANIIMTGGNFTPIGPSDDNRFEGTYDGGGYSIAGLTVTTTGWRAGLFGQVGRNNSGGTLKNIILVNPSATNNNGNAGSSCGALVGKCSFCTITNCHVINPTVGAWITSNTTVGTIIGVAYTDDPNTNCYFYSSTGTGFPAIGNLVSYNPVRTANIDRAYKVTFGTGVTTSTAPAFTYDGTSYYTGTITLVPSAGGSVIDYYVDGSAIEGDTYNVQNDVTITAKFNGSSINFSGKGTADSPYLISSENDWDNFCEALQDKDNWNCFSGKHLKLNANISVTRMAGSDGHEFQGNFNGGSHTLTFTATATNNYCAPFRNVEGGSTAEAATTIDSLNVVTTITGNGYRHMAGLIALQSGHVNVTDCNATVGISSTTGANNSSDLYPAGLVSQVSADKDGTLTVSGCTVRGEIATNGKYAAGMVGIVQGIANITNSVSSVTIKSSTADDGTHGGLVASTNKNTSITISGCVFNGSLLSSKGTSKCGGFIGWRGGGATIYNSLFAPTEVTVSKDGSATFARNGADTYNCYYTISFFNSNYTPSYAPYDPKDTTRPDKYNNGKQGYTISADNNVTVSFSGEGTEYAVSGITAYATGIKYSANNTDVYYAGPNETVGLTLSHGDLDGYTFAGYQPSAGELNGMTLTMPEAGNVTIKATWNTTATVQVAWNDFDDLDGLRPSAVTATLPGDIEVTLNAGNNWTATVENLPAFDASDQLIAYSWTADAPEGYVASSSASGTVTTLTFSHTPTVTLFAAGATNTLTTWCDADAWLTPEGCTVFTVSSVADGTVTLQPLDDQTVIPAYTPVVIRRNTTGTAVVAEYSSRGTGTEGIQTAGGTTGFSFYGTTTALSTTGFASYYTYGQTYVLYGGMFLLYDTNNGVPANRCWLNVSSTNAARLGISFGETTSMLNAECLLNEAGTEWYTLDGRKLDKRPTAKGVYVNGGHKVVVK